MFIFGILEGTAQVSQIKWRKTSYEIICQPNQFERFLSQKNGSENILCFIEFVNKSPINYRYILVPFILPKENQVLEIPIIMITKLFQKCYRNNNWKALQGPNSH